MSDKQCKYCPPNGECECSPEWCYCDPDGIAICRGHVEEREAELRKKLNAALAMIEEYTSWKPNIGIIKPSNVVSTHGSCCNCRDCGESYDECVCEHNYIENALAIIDGEDK